MARNIGVCIAPGYGANETCVSAGAYKDKEVSFNEVPTRVGSSYEARFGHILQLPIPGAQDCGSRLPYGRPSEYWRIVDYLADMVTLEAKGGDFPGVVGVAVEGQLDEDGQRIAISSSRALVGNALGGDVHEAIGRAYKQHGLIGLQPPIVAVGGVAEGLALSHLYFEQHQADRAAVVGVVASAAPPYTLYGARAERVRAGNDIRLMPLEARTPPGDLLDGSRPPLDVLLQAASDLAGTALPANSTVPTTVIFHGLFRHVALDAPTNNPDTNVRFAIGNEVLLVGALALARYIISQPYE